MDLKIHIGFGFHVNLYHSFRGDSNDDMGFGGDIRVIRKIIEVLNSYNRHGVMVKGTWDFENAYSLENILPRHAPDIIQNIKERVMNNEDEIILMSYNNGLISCMDEKEFTASIDWAITNPFKSGVVDIFGSYAPMVRPQEMMFSPSNIFLYKKLGIKALCLYYSGVPFDGFRTIIPLLPEAHAFNPLWYEYKGEKMIIMPAISHSDLVDYGGLRSLVSRLHHKQALGEISTDVMIFINLDADALLWYGIQLPFPADRLPLTGGLHGLIKDTADLDYVVFDTPYNYIKSHPPLEPVSFQQDIADGMFDGYASWAEKPFNQLVWTRIENARITNDKALWLLDQLKNKKKAAKARRLLEQAFYDKLCVMSTTHFGLAAPLINKDREKKALQWSSDMTGNASKAWKELQQIWLEENESTVTGDINKLPVNEKVIPLLIDRQDASMRFINMTLSLEKGVVSDRACLTLQDREGRNVESAFLDVAWHEDGSFAEIQIFAFPGVLDYHRLNIHINDKCNDKPHSWKIYVSERRLSGEGICVISDGKNIEEVTACGMKLGGKDFFRSYIKYYHGIRGEEYDFQVRARELLIPGRGGKIAGYRFHGTVDIPGQLKQGGFLMDLFIVEGIPALMVRMDIEYPYTPEKDVISNEVAVLGRFCDCNWIEVAPIQVKPQISEHAYIIKQNYQGDINSYCVDDFKKADERNTLLDSFNHHITAGFIGITDGKNGLAVAVDRARLSSMAFCPMRMHGTSQGVRVSLNPFGTYFGKQRYHKTYTGGVAQKLMVAASPYHRSLAPAYNGVTANFMLALFPFRGGMPAEKISACIKAFSNGSAFFELPNDYSREKRKENIILHVHEKESISPDIHSNYSPLSKGIPLELKLKVFLNIIKSWFLH